MLAKGLVDELPQLRIVADKNQFEVPMTTERRCSRAHDHLGAEVAAHGIKGNDRVIAHRSTDRTYAGQSWMSLLVVVDRLRLGNNLVAAVETIRRNTMTQMRLARHRIDRQRRLPELVV